MSLLTDREPFDVCGPLPSGVTVLEASAGTGKTYTIAALAARYVAEGTPLRRPAARHVHADGDRRAARAGARAAGRAPSGRSARCWRAPSRTRATRSCGCSPTGRARGRAPRRARLARALPTSTPRRSPPRTASARRCSAGSAWPATSSATPSSSRTSRDLRRGGRRRPLRARASTAAGRAAVHARRGAARSREIAVGNPGAPIEPPDAGRRRCPAMRGAWPTAVRAELERRKRAPRVMTYDDLLTRLQRRAAPAAAAHAVARAAARALPRRARRRVPGHRPGPVGHPAARVRRRRRRSC